MKSRKPSRLAAPTSEPVQPRASLRERQKSERRDRIVAAAESLFSKAGYEATTMAEVADRAGVSRPTVFNYFRSKEELLLALVLGVHHTTQARITAFEPVGDDTPAEALCRFLRVYTETSLASIDKATWRHVESTQIRMPDSDFVQQYDRLTDEMLGDFRTFIGRLAEMKSEASVLLTEPLPRLIFNHWAALFIDFVRDDSQSIDDHVDRLRQDLGSLLKILLRDGGVSG